MEQEFRSSNGSAERSRNRRGNLADGERKHFECVGYCDNDKRSVGVYNYQFNESHQPTDARKLDESNLPEFDMLCAGFPCFAEDTLILTFEGYKPIREIKVGDLVLTHKRKWHKVTGTMQRYADKTITLKGQGIYELTTTYEHPFLVRRKTERYRNRKYSAEWGQPEWVDAGKLDATTRVGETFPEQLDCSFTPDFWWVVGRYIADGWVVKRKNRKEGNGRVVISCGKHKFENTRKAIEKVFHAVVVEERTAYKFHIVNSEFYKFVQQFGCGAGNKSIPGRYLGLEPVRARALLEGYLSGDGSCDEKRKCWNGTTVSKNLAYSILLLNFAVNGTIGSLSKCKMSKTTIIEGRIVNQRDFYTIRLPSRNKSAFVDENSYGWKRIRNIEQNSGRLVYNISVEEDESYIAENAIVHNCQPFSLAGKRKGFDEERGTLFHEIVRILEIRKPEFVLLENVKGLLSAQRGYCFAFILSRLSELGYGIEWEVLNSKNFGVPQNRERVFIFGSRTKGRPEIFPLGQGDCVSEAEDGGKRKGGKRIQGEVSSTIDARYGALRNAGETYLVDPYNAVVKKGDCATTVRTNFSDGNSWIIDASSERKPRVYEKTCPTLNTMQGGQRQPIVLNQHYMRTGERGDGISEGQTTTLDSGCGRDIVITPNLESGSLRRLTPKECERLQGFPDSWSLHEKVGNEVKVVSDSARYKMLGNAVTVNVVQAVGEKILEANEK